MPEVTRVHACELVQVYVWVERQTCCESVQTAQCSNNH